jgi:hypothetical protein
MFHNQEELNELRRLGNERKRERGVENNWTTSTEGGSPGVNAVSQVVTPAVQRTRARTPGASGNSTSRKRVIPMTPIPCALTRSDSTIAI